MYYEFEIEGRLPSLNEYINACRKHYQQGATFKRRLEERVCLDIYKARTLGYLPVKPVECPVRAHFTFYEKNYKRDIDNVSALARKVILDALVQTGVLIDDSPKYVVGLVDNFCIGKDEKIIVQLEEQNPKKALTDNK